MQYQQEIHTNGYDCLDIRLRHLQDGGERELRIGLLYVSVKQAYVVFTCLDEGFVHQSITDNLFAEFQSFRKPFEAQGWRFLCKGALRNCRPSGMGIQMSLGRRAYVFPKNRTPGICDLHDIFAPEAGISGQDCVLEQERFWQDYCRRIGLSPATK